MLAIELIRTDPDLVRRAVDSRGDTVDIDRILELDERRRAVARASRFALFAGSGCSPDAAPALFC